MACDTPATPLEDISGLLVEYGLNKTTGQQSLCQPSFGAGRQIFPGILCPGTRQNLPVGSLYPAISAGSASCSGPAPVPLGNNAGSGGLLAAKRRQA
jgi:hypothetical protein